MIYLKTIILCSSLLFLGAGAAGPLEFPVERLPRSEGPSLHHRDILHPALLNGLKDRDGGLYYFNVSVGTPGQLQTVSLDTGSSDTIFIAAKFTVYDIWTGANSTCESMPGCPGGTFNETLSSTYKEVVGGLEEGQLDINFADGTWRAGPYSTDVIQIGDLSITGAQFGLAYEGQTPTNHCSIGLLGLGYASNEGVIYSNGTLYPNFLETLVHARAIPSRLYSIYLNQLDQIGSLVFGGVDTAKISRPLTTLNLLAEKGKVTGHFGLNLDEITTSTPDGKKHSFIRSVTNNPQPVLLDIGAPKWKIPEVAYQQILAMLGDEETGSRPCSQVTRGHVNTTFFHLHFSGSGGSNAFVLHLELADLYTPLMESHSGKAATNDAGQSICIPEIREGDSQGEWPDVGSNLGNAVMKAGYWVFDLDNGQVSIGQANLGTTASDIVAVEAGSDGLQKIVEGLVGEVQENEVEGMVGKEGRVFGKVTMKETVGYATGTDFYPPLATCFIEGEKHT
ncbi:acid protease [Aureobasidium subglaciale]|nr:acid protease [Aureobasidium subglaciale]